MVQGNLLPIIIAKASKALGKSLDTSSCHDINIITSIIEVKIPVEVPDSTDGIKLKIASPCTEKK